jgi:catechol 2,3-dioxygenase-like lactoylglutathione lyase family enzyme
MGIEAAAFDAWREHLHGQGVAVEKEVEWPKGGKSLYVRDPAGNSVELVTPGLWGLPGGW